MATNKFFDAMYAPRFLEGSCREQGQFYFLRGHEACPYAPGSTYGQEWLEGWYCTYVWTISRASEMKDLDAKVLLLGFLDKMISSYSPLAGSFSPYFHDARCKVASWGYLVGKPTYPTLAEDYTDDNDPQ